MINIIKVELFRLKKSKLFWIMLGVSAASPLLSMALSLIVTNILLSIAGGGSMNLVETMGITSSLLSGLTQIAGDAALWSLITSAVVLSKEFSDGTMRNVVLANKSRAELFFGYLITAMIVGVTYLTASFAAILLIAAPISGFDGMKAAEGVTAFLCSYSLGILAIAFVQTCVCMFLFGTRKQWATVLFPILICMFAPSIFTTFITIVTTVKAVQGEVVNADFTRWIPFANMSYYNPADIDGAMVGMNILYLGIFTTMFILIGYYTFKKADLK